MVEPHENCWCNTTLEGKKIIYIEFYLCEICQIVNLNDIYWRMNTQAYKWKHSMEKHSVKREFDDAIEREKTNKLQVNRVQREFLSMRSIDLISL